MSANAALLEALRQTIDRDSLIEGAFRVVDVSSEDGIVSLIVGRLSGGLVVYENRCPHAGWPLEKIDGRLIIQDGRYIVCAAHAASFDAATGACVGGPCGGDGLRSLLDDPADPKD